MKKFILDFNQRKSVEYGLNLIELHILDYIIQANGNPTKFHTVHNNLSYVGLTFDEILEDIPVLQCDEETLANIFVELENKGLIISATAVDENGKYLGMLYTTTDKTFSLIDDDF